MYDPKTLVLCSAISEVFVRRLAKQGFVKYTEGSEFIDTREDLIENGDPEGGGLKEMDEKLKKYDMRHARLDSKLTCYQSYRESERPRSVPLRLYWCPSSAVTSR